MRIKTFFIELNVNYYIYILIKSSILKILKMKIYAIKEIHFENN